MLSLQMGHGQRCLCARGGMLETKDSKRTYAPQPTDHLPRLPSSMRLHTRIHFLAVRSLVHASKQQMQSSCELLGTHRITNLWTACSTVEHSADLPQPWEI